MVGELPAVTIRIAGKSRGTRSFGAQAGELTVGFHNMGYRGMMMDDEVLCVTAGG